MSDLLLELYVVGLSRHSQAAIANLRRICEIDLPGRCSVQVVDILENPEAAEEANILATPTLIKRSPPPVRRIVGDLSNTRLVVDSLDFGDRHAVEAADIAETHADDGSDEF